MKLDTSLMEVSIGVNGKTFERNLIEDLKVDKVNLGEELMRQPEMFAWWATLAEAAKDISRRADMNVVLLEARIGRDLRLDAAKHKVRATEKGLEEALHMSGKWLKAVNEKLEARRQANVLTACVIAMSQRASMLASLSGIINRDAAILEKAAKGEV